MRVVNLYVPDWMHGGHQYISDDQLLSFIAEVGCHHNSTVIDGEMLTRVVSDAESDYLVSPYDMSAAEGLDPGQLERMWFHNA